MSDDTNGFDMSDIPGYDPATGEIHDDPGLEDGPSMHLPGADDLRDLLGTSGMPDDQPLPFDPDHPFDPSTIDDPMHDPFVEGHPELFGGSEAEE